MKRRAFLIGSASAVAAVSGQPALSQSPPVPGQPLAAGDYRVISLEKLIELKLASGLAPHRVRDLGDVQESGAQGVGLFRTEFAYMDRSWWPS